MNEIYEADFVKTMKSYEPLRPIEALVEELNKKDEEIIKLNGNENPFDTPSEVLRSLCTLKNIQIYPDPLCEKLVEILAEKEKIATEKIFVGSGIDEILDLIIRGFTNPEDIILSQFPTFGMYSFLSQINRVEYKSIPLKMHIDNSFIYHGIDEKIFLEEASKATIVILARPNNPDGQITSENFIKKLLKLPLMVIIDEAYIEYSDTPSLVKWVKSYDNLIVMRTFSKAFGLGGLRVGYGLMSPRIKNILLKIKQPYNVNIAGQKIAREVLKSNTLQNNIKTIKVTRKEFISFLEELQLQYKNFLIYPSQTNFVLLRMNNISQAKQLYEHLHVNNIFVRYYDSPKMQNFLRISIGRPEQMKIVGKAISEFLLEVNL